MYIYKCKHASPVITFSVYTAFPKWVLALVFFSNLQPSLLACKFIVNMPCKTMQTVSILIHSHASRLLKPDAAIQRFSSALMLRLVPQVLYICLGSKLKYWNRKYCVQFDWFSCFCVFFPFLLRFGLMNFLVSILSFCSMQFALGRHLRWVCPCRPIKKDLKISLLSYCQLL